jgi:WD40 repeat protein
MESESNSDEKLRVFSDQIGGDKILSGNVAGSVAAIGAGANVIYTKVERALTDIESLEQTQRFENKRLAEALTDYVHRLELQAARAKEDPGYGNPYKALLEFDIQDAALFYGRTIAIRELLAHIKRDQLTVLHAGSGLGKTSLLKAGIMPRLLADGHLPIYLRPYQTPVHMALKRALLVNVDDAPRLASISLHDFLLQATNLMSGGQLIIIIDQFEELFTVQNEQARYEFVDQLCSCLDDDLLPVRWILGIRDEWFGQLGTFRPHIRNPYANEFLLRPLTRTEAALVITQPAARRQVAYEPSLVERLMDDMGRDEIAPPHLQLVCSMLFDSLMDRMEITQAMYEEAGEAKGILRGYLYRVISRDMPQEMRAPAHRLLEALVTSEKRRALRTREDLETELSAWGYSVSMVDGVISQLTDSRLLRVEEFKLDNIHSVAAYELAHDYLLEEIDLTPEVQARKAAQELITQKLPFYKREKLLLSADELSIILPQRQWLTLTEEEAALLKESEAAATRQRQRIRMGIGAAVLLLIVAIATIGILQGVSANRYERIASTAVVAEQQKASIAQTAVAAGATAQAESTISLSRKLAVEAELAKTLGQPIRAYQFAAQSYQTADIFESRSALYSALSIPLAERIFQVPADVVFTANFSPDSERMVTGSSDNMARIWDVETGKELFTLKGHEKQVLYGEFSSDNKRIVTSSDDGTFRIWDAQNGNLLQTVQAKEAELQSAVFSPDGKLIVTAGRDGTGALWSASNGKRLFLLKGHKEPLMFANFSPDGTRVVTTSDDDTARVWSAVNGRNIITLEGHKGNVNYATFSPDGKWILTASNDRTARVWDARTGKTLLILVPHEGDVTSANFSPDGRFIITSCSDHRTRLWDAVTGALITNFVGQTDKIRWAGFSPDGRWIATTSYDSSVWLRQAFGMSGTSSFFGHARDLPSVDITRDGSRIVVASWDRTASVWDVLTGKRLLTLVGHGKGIDFASFNPDGSRIATASGDKTVRLWNANDGNEIYQLPIHANAVTFSPREGTQMLTAGKDNIVRVWNTETGAEIPPALEGHKDEVNYAAFSPDESLIVTAGGTDDGTVRLWDAKTHKLLHTYQIMNGDEVNSATFSPDGTRLVIAADSGTAQIWDIKRGEKIVDLTGHVSDVGSAVYSPDGKKIVTASDDQTVRLWDALTGEPLAVLQGHTDEVSWALFSPDGKWIFSASNDRTVRTWPVDFKELYTLVREELTKLKVE